MNKTDPGFKGTIGLLELRLRLAKLSGLPSDWMAEQEIQMLLGKYKKQPY